MHRIYLLILLILLVVSTATTLFVISYYSPRPGISLSFKLYDIDVVNKKIVDKTNILNDPDVVLSIEVEAIAPHPIEKIWFSSIKLNTMVLEIFIYQSRKYRVLPDNGLKHTI